MILSLIEKRMPKDMDEAARRSAYGKAASVVGILGNVVLFAGKAAAGFVSGSVSVMADAVNNLSDASSSIISLFGFKLAEMPADARHPYGHGRFEYLSGLMVAVMILVIGVELLKGSIVKIIHPEAVVFRWMTVGVLAVSIAAKLWLSHFNRVLAQKIQSTALEATADDSRNDVISTGAVLAAALLAHFTGLNLDGWMGAGVAVFILVSGFGLICETINPLLGSKPDPEEVKHIRKKILDYPGVLGVHDLMIHDYGPGREFASVHVEMPASDDPLVSHDVIDNIEQDFLKNEHLHLVVHYDPVVTDDPRIPVMRRLITDIVKRIDPKMSIHDLRIVPGPSHVNVVFDCIVPYGCLTSPKEIESILDREIKAYSPNYHCVATLEHSYIS